MYLELITFAFSVQNFQYLFYNKVNVFGYTLYLFTYLLLLANEPMRVVGIVGIGHVPGITQLWGTVKEEDIAPIIK